MTTLLPKPFPKFTLKRQGTDTTEEVSLSCSFGDCVFADHSTCKREREHQQKKATVVLRTSREQETLRMSAPSRLERAEAQSSEKAIALITKALAHIKSHDLESYCSMFTSNAHFQFHDVDKSLNHEMNLAGFQEEMHRLLDSFPDFSFTWKSIQSHPTPDGGVVVSLVNVVATGTHTGAAYAFGPCDPINATGQTVQTDPEDKHYHFSNTGSLVSLKVYPKGEMSGMAGVYTKLGGFPLL